MLKFMEKIQLPSESIAFVFEFYEKIKNDAEFQEIIKGLENKVSTHEVHLKIIEYSEKKNYNKFEVCLTVLCNSWYIFKQRYDEKGINEELFYACMQDIRYKVFECRETYGIWGISCFEWYDGYLRANRFELGRLQFESWSLEQESYTFGDTTIKKGDTIVNIHIPSSGPLYPDAVCDSLKKACDFFEYKYDNKMFIICKSWLLYPAYRKLFKEGSNLACFYDLFHIFDSVKDETFSFGHGFVFRTPKTNDISSLPQNTSLQRSFAEYMKSENADFGRGYGMIVMENGKIIN